MNEYMERLDDSLKPTLSVLLQASAVEMKTLNKSLKAQYNRAKELRGQATPEDCPAELLLEMVINQLNIFVLNRKFYRNQVITGLTNLDEVLEDLNTSISAAEGMADSLRIALRKVSA